MLLFILFVRILHYYFRRNIINNNISKYLIYIPI